MECEKCVLCFQDADTLKSWEVNWSLDCAQSIHKLLDLELFSISFFEVASYCAKCKEIIRDVDFMTRSISALENRLSITRMKIAQMLVDNFSAWAGFDKDNTEQPISTTCSPNSPNVTDNFLEEDGNPYQPDTFDAVERLPYKEDPCLDASENYAEMFEHGMIESEIPAGNPIAKKNGFNNYSGTRRNLTESENYKFVRDFPNCLKKFRTPYHLDSHKPTHIGCRRFKCTHGSCEKAFTRRQHHVRHMKNFHDHPDKNKLLKRKQDVKAKPRKKKFQATLNGVEVGVKFPCDYPGCGSEFTTLYLLDCHKPAHTGWRGFTCPEKSCQKTYRWRTHLIRHIKMSHGGQNRIQNKSSSKLRAHLVPHDTSNTIEFPEQTISESTVNQSKITINQSEATINQSETTINQSEVTVNEAVSAGNNLEPDSIEPSNRKSTRLLHKPKVLPLPIFDGSDCEDNDFHSDSDLSYAASTSDGDDKDLEHEEEIYVSKNLLKETGSKPSQHKPQVPSLQELCASSVRTKNVEIFSKVANRSTTFPETQNATPREMETRKGSMKTFGKVENRHASKAEVPGPGSSAQEAYTQDASTEGLRNISNVTNGNETAPEAQGPSAQEMDKWKGSMKNLENLNDVSKQIAAECYTEVEIANKELYKCATSDWKLFVWETLLGSTQIPEETFESTFLFLLKLNQIEVEKNLNTNYKCAVGDCYRGFKTQDDWKHHLLIYHGKYEQIFECPFCTTNIFRTGVRLDSHISKVHLGQIRPHFCPVSLCESRYPFKNKLQRHMAQQHPSYECAEHNADDRQLHRKRTLFVNIKTGKPSRVVYCKVNGCTYRTPFPKYLNAHMIKKHGSASNTPAYKCDTCGMGFSCMRTYKPHSRHAHKSQEERSKCLPKW